MDTNVVELDEVKNMLGDDPKYLKQFCEAAVISFSEFKNNFESSMINRDLEKLRKAGHKIKPAAQMIGVDRLVSEYENAKELLESDADENKIQKSVEKQSKYCELIIEDFNNQINQT